MAVLISSNEPRGHEMLKSAAVESHQEIPKANLANSSVAKSDLIRIGVVGYGYWGPNIVRNFHGQEGSQVVAVCDSSPKVLSEYGHHFRVPGSADLAENRCPWDRNSGLDSFFLNRLK